MADIQIVKTDQGAVNARILAREAKADFRRVEAASLKVRTHFTSAEAKRLFVRMFNTLQLNAHFISVIARTRIDHQDIEKVEASLRADIDAAKNKLNQALDGAEALFKAHGISSFATYDTQPLELEVGILSSSGRRYLEVLNQLDQLMPLLQTLEIHEVISTQELDIQRAALKRQIKDIANAARRLATGLRRRMNAMAAREGEPGEAAPRPGAPAAGELPVDAAAVLDVGHADEAGAEPDPSVGRAPEPGGGDDPAHEAMEQATGPSVLKRVRRKPASPEADREAGGQPGIQPQGDAGAPSDPAPTADAGAPVDSAAEAEPRE